MKGFHREVLRKARDIVREAGGECEFQDRAGGKHARLIIEINGKRRFTPLSGSPGRPEKALHYKLGDVRRIVRELSGNA